ncbi:MAG TPA: peptidylprolyl isomerase [Candidatus Paceibacterota bacterium]
MHRVYISLAIVVLAVGGYIYFTNHKEAQDSSRVIPDSFENTGTETPPILPPQTPKTMNATFETNKGNIEIELLANDVPNTVANFVKLAESGFYNGTRFHRVIKNFMIQGGDPLSKDLSQQSRWGTGGPGYQFADEIGPNNHNSALTIAMANAGPNTNGSQFFINTVDNNYLDTKHTVFGKVVSGVDVVHAIENSPTEGPDRPIDEVVVKKVIITK